MKSRSDFTRTPYLSLTSLTRAPLFERSVKIERALSTKMRDASDVGLKIILAKFSCDLCDGLTPDTIISLILSKSKFTSRSCSGDFLCSTFFSDLFAFSASQNVVLRSFSLSSRRSRIPINNFMSPFISSMPAIGRSTNPWAAGVSCCFLDLKSSSTTRSGIFKGSNRRLFFGLPGLFRFARRSFTILSSIVWILGRSSSRNTATSWGSHLSNFERRAVNCPASSFLEHLRLTPTTWTWHFEAALIQV